MPILTPGWSLNFEMFFYLLFCFVLIFPLGRRIFISGMLFAALALTHFLLPSPGSAGSPAAVAVAFLTDTRIFEFWFGMIIGQIYLAEILRVPRSLCMAALLGGLIVILAPRGASAYGPWANLVFTMLPAAAIVLGMVALEQNFGMWKMPLPLLLGDASYSIYLSHILILGLARVLWVRAGLGHGSVVNAMAFAVFSMALVLLGSVVVYRLFERPVTSALQRIFQRQRGTVSQAPASMPAAGPKDGPI